MLVEEATELVLGADCSQAPDTYIRVFLLPDKSTNMQTRVRLGVGWGGGELMLD